jgi:flagellar protein FlaG
LEIDKTATHSELMKFESISPITPQEQVLRRQLIRAVTSVNSSHLFGMSTELTFTYDRQSRKTVLQIVDRETKEVLRQLPPEYLLRLAEGLDGE